MLRGRHLDRWIDFKAHQVFEEAITYTALQFYTREPREVVRIAAAPHGEAADIVWSDPDLLFHTMPSQRMANGLWPPARSGR